MPPTSPADPDPKITTFLTCFFMFFAFRFRSLEREPKCRHLGPNGSRNGSRNAEKCHRDAFQKQVLKKNAQMGAPKARRMVFYLNETILFQEARVPRNTSKMKSKMTSICHGIEKTSSKKDSENRCENRRHPGAFLSKKVSKKTPGPA